MTLPKHESGLEQFVPVGDERDNGYGSGRIGLSELQMTEKSPLFVISAMRTVFHVC